MGMDQFLFKVCFSRNVSRAPPPWVVYLISDAGPSHIVSSLPPGRLYSLLHPFTCICQGWLPAMMPSCYLATIITMQGSGSLPGPVFQHAHTDTHGPVMEQTQ